MGTFLVQNCLALNNEQYINRPLIFYYTVKCITNHQERLKEVTVPVMSDNTIKLQNNSVGN